MPGRRIALFGGSFDPPHRGHVEVARSAADTFGLNEVIFMPTGKQPLKPWGAVAPYANRLAMVSLLCGLDERFSTSGLDAPRPDGMPNYTIDTLEALTAAHPGADLFAIAGADSFLDLPRWRGAERLLDLARWIVVSRPGFSLAQLRNLKLPPKLLDRVQVLETVHEPVSATELRTRLSLGLDCSGAIPEEVLAFLRLHQLYR